MSSDFVDTSSYTLFPVKLDTNLDDVQKWIDEFIEEGCDADSFDNEFPPIIKVKPSKDDPNLYNIHISICGYTDNYADDVMHQIASKFFNKNQIAYTMEMTNQVEGSSFDVAVYHGRDMAYYVSAEEALQFVVKQLHDGKMTITKKRELIWKG